MTQYPLDAERDCGVPIRGWN